MSVQRSYCQRMFGKCSKCGGKHIVIMCGIKLGSMCVTEDSTKVTGAGTLTA